MEHPGYFSRSGVTAIKFSKVGPRLKQFSWQTLNLGQRAEAEAIGLKEQSPFGLDLLARRALPFQRGGFSPAPPGREGGLPTESL